MIDEDDASPRLARANSVGEPRQSRERSITAGWASSTVTFLSSILDVNDRSTRSSLLGLRIVELAMSDEASVGPWLVERLGI